MDFTKRMASTVELQQELDELKKTVVEKDTLIDVMKQKTKDYVTKLKSDHQNEILIMEVYAYAMRNTK